MRPETARRPIRAPGRALTAVLLAVLVLAGCSSQKPKAAPEPSPTPIANLNTSVIQVPRIDFCKLVPAAAVKAALGAPADDTAAYGNGDVETLDTGRKDVLHEIGCTWRTSAGSTARAWVFARPVTPDFAQVVIRSSARTRGCTTVAGPAYGQPSTTQQCTLPNGEVRARHAGLFGQTWLTCETSSTAGVPAPEVRERADAWCVEVANSLNTAR